MRYRELAEKKGAGNAAPKRIIFYRGNIVYCHGDRIYQIVGLIYDM